MEETKPWVRRFSRVGYMAKGVVYIIIGVLALLAAVGPGGETTGTTGAVESVSTMPFGKLLLWIIGIGLFGYIVWNLIKAIKDPQGEGSDAKGWIKRIGYFVSAIIYGNLAIGAILLASRQKSSSGGGESEKEISARLMEQPFGVWLIGLLGLIILLYGLYELQSGARLKFMEQLKTHEMNAKEKEVAEKSGRVGLIARGIVLGIIGFFFTRTAWTHNPEESKGVGGALDELASQPYGTIVLGIVATGLILYGIYQFIRGRYEKMNYGRQ
ncbi:DUF1206 domain-containing protein [Chryseomicrobium sp. FSL W7-1435]|uniref:DUF1206 domain-containing protein n=1 Tax=Chryseomicrobium sp. FSL W7-1435 TaxID=2921704 RepID=UPI00315A8FB0